MHSWAGRQGKGICVKLAECEKVGASKTTPRERNKQGTTANERLVTLVAELGNVKAAYSRLEDGSTQAEKGANKARSEIRDLQVRSPKVGREA